MGRDRHSDKAALMFPLVAFLVGVLVSMIDPIIAGIGVFLGYLWARNEAREIVIAVVIVGILGWLGVWAHSGDPHGLYYGFLQVCALICWCAISIGVLRIWAARHPASK